MNPSTQRALDRLLKTMARPPRRRRSRFSTAPLILALGLILGYQLLVRLVPRVWNEMLPGGMRQARSLPGWPGVVGRLAWFCYWDFRTVMVIGGAFVALAIVVSAWLRPLRILVWLAAVAAILADAGILYVTLRTAYDATTAASGIGQGPAPVLISPHIEDLAP